MKIYMSKLIQVLKDAYDQLDIIKEEIINLEKEYQRLKRQEFIDAVKSIKAQNHSEPPQIGDKYIIEIESHMTNKHGDLYGIKGFNALVFDKNGLDRLEKLADQYTIAGYWTPRMPVTDDEDTTFF